MIYTAYQAQSDLTAPMRAMSGATARLLTDLSPGLTDRWMVRSTLATTEIVARWGLTHRRPAFGIESVEVEGEAVAVREEAVLRTPFGDAAAVREGHGRGATARAARRAAVGPLRDAAARDGPHDAAGPRRLHHRLAQRARRRGPPRPVRPRRVHRPPRRLPARDGTGGARRRGLPAVRAGARGGRAHGRGRRRGGAAQPDADGRPDRRAREPDDRQRPRGRALARVVRAQRDRDRAAAVRRGRPPRVPRVRPGRRVHADEPGAPSRGVPAPVRRHRRRERGARGRDEGVLRRVLRGARPDGRVLPRDHRRHLPGPPPRAGRVRRGAAAPSSPPRSRGRRCSRSRASATTSAASARPPPRTTCAPRSRRTGAASTSRPGPGISASSAAPGGSARCTPRSAATS